MLSRRALLAVFALYVAALLLQVRCTPAKPSRQKPQLVVEELRSVDAVVDLRMDAGADVRRAIPPKPANWQKQPPCNAEMGEEAINGACYIALLRPKPPCGRLPEHNGVCYRAVAKAKREPSSLGQ